MRFIPYRRLQPPRFAIAKELGQQQRSRVAGGRRRLQQPLDFFEEYGKRSRSRPRTRSCRSAITASTETSVAKLVAYACPYLNVAAAGRDHAIPLLEAEEDLEGARLTEHVLDGIATFDRALSGLIRVAVL